MTTLPKITSVAIIGAGASGLVAARALRAQRSQCQCQFQCQCQRAFPTIDVYEQRGDAGGVWNYTPQTALVPIPNTDPLACCDRDTGGGDNGCANGSGSKVYLSAMYDGLGTPPLFSPSPSSSPSSLLSPPSQAHRWGGLTKGEKTKLQTSQRN